MCVFTKSSLCVELLVFCLVTLVYFFFGFVVVVSTGAIDCPERLISKMAYHVSGGTLNPTHLLTFVFYLLSATE